MRFQVVNSWFTGTRIIGVTLQLSLMIMNQPWNYTRRKLMRVYLLLLLQDQLYSWERENRVYLINALLMLRSKVYFHSKAQQILVHGVEHHLYLCHQLDRDTHRTNIAELNTIRKPVQLSTNFQKTLGVPKNVQSSLWKLQKTMSAEEMNKLHKVFSTMQNYQMVQKTVDAVGVERWIWIMMLLMIYSKYIYPVC